MIENIIKYIVNIILWIWQAPQNVLGAFLFSQFKIKGYELYNGKDIFTIEHSSWFPGVSLGDIILISEDFKGKDLENTKRHEWGHTRQSLILGPLYLVTIGILSICGNILSRYWKWLYINYYNQPWEKWADKLGGVKR